MNVGILAGTGSLPCDAAIYFEQKQIPYTFFSLISPEHAHFLQMQHPCTKNSFFLNKYRLAESLEKLKTENITHALAVGKLEKASIFSITKFDALGLKILFSLSTQSDLSIIKALEKLLAQQNIILLPQNLILQKTMLHQGFSLGTLSAHDLESISFGMHIASVIAHYEIGQTIIVKNKIVIAVEGVEGTNACIQRAHELAGNDLIVCKTYNNKDQKADLPTLGAETIHSVPSGSIKAIAWHARKTIIAQPQQFIEVAKKCAVALRSL